jgi:hypothetical protein
VFSSVDVHFLERNPSAAACRKAPCPIPELISTPVWDDALLHDAGVPIIDCQLASVGGGLGSFALVDFLLIAGMAAPSIKVLSNLSAPWETFAARVRASQMQPQDRLRSDSSATIGNIWGWPGYAWSEAWAERTLTPLWKVLTEPLLSEYFTPRVHTVLAGIEREAARIGWKEMLVPCWAETVRRRANGGYFVFVRPRSEEGVVAYRCQHVHLAPGHPGPRLLPEVSAFRARHGGAGQIVNGYEPHDHVYEQLIRAPGRVVLRGAGITVSRILERLVHDRDRFGAQTEIIHLFRNYIRGSSGPPWFRRPGGNGFAYQPFNFPKAAGGGQLRQRTLALSGDERALLIKSMSGTTTPWRRNWQKQLARGRREGWYQSHNCAIVDIGVTAGRRLNLALSHVGGPECQLVADFLIDATGLEDSIRRHPLLADLLDHGCVALNALGRLDVEPSFELRGARSGAGRMYASGAATFGGALAPVDSFWGLTHAAMEICDELAGEGLCEFPGALDSICQWWRLMRNQPP